MTDLEQSKYQVRNDFLHSQFEETCLRLHNQNCEWRISIYGRKLDEWDKLAKWIIDNKLFSHNVRWLVQIPRLYDLFKQNGLVKNFEDVIRSEFSHT